MEKELREQLSIVNGAALLYTSSQPLLTLCFKFYTSCFSLATKSFAKSTVRNFSHAGFFSKKKYTILYGILSMPQKYQIKELPS